MSNLSISAARRNFELGRQRRRDEAIARYRAANKRCKFCDNVLTYTQRKNKFCTHSCAAAYNNKGVRRHGFPEKRICATCGKRKTYNHHTSCRKCIANLRYQEYIIRWLNHKESGMSSHGKTHDYVRRYILEINKHKCQQCGWNQQNKYTGAIPVEIHHKDGNWENTTPANLELLCPNCHSLTKTYRSGNRGKGRPQEVR